jgi:hypothetical protein
VRVRLWATSALRDELGQRGSILVAQGQKLDAHARRLVSGGKTSYPCDPALSANRLLPLGNSEFQRQPLAHFEEYIALQERSARGEVGGIEEKVSHSLGIPTSELHLHRSAYIATKILCHGVRKRLGLREGVKAGKLP